MTRARTLLGSTLDDLLRLGDGLVETLLLEKDEADHLAGLEELVGPVGGDAQLGNGGLQVTHAVIAHAEVEIALHVGLDGDGLLEGVDSRPGNPSWRS